MADKQTTDPAAPESAEAHIERHNATEGGPRDERHDSITQDGGLTDEAVRLRAERGIHNTGEQAPGDDAIEGEGEPEPEAA